MARKRKTVQESEGGGKSKELKIITVQVVTRDKVLSNPRQMALLYIINKLGPMHERTIHQIVSDVQELGVDLGYKFSIVGGVPYSQDLKSDLVALLYVGFIETEPTPFRRLRVTGDGREALEKYKVPDLLFEVIEKNYERLRNKASILDSHLDTEIRAKLRERGRPRRFI